MRVFMDCLVIVVIGVVRDRAGARLIHILIINVRSDGAEMCGAFNLAVRYFMVGPQSNRANTNPQSWRCEIVFDLIVVVESLRVIIGVISSSGASRFITFMM